MAMIPTATQYEFTSIENLLAFIKPLIIEGYSIATRTEFKPFPREYSIEKYVVYVVDKDREMKITVKDPKGDKE